MEMSCGFAPGLKPGFDANLSVLRLVGYYASAMQV